MRKLWPPLETIEARLRQTSDADTDTGQLNFDNGGKAEPLPMPDFIREQIDRAVAAHAVSNTALAPGVIVLAPVAGTANASKVQALPHSVAFCLDAAKVRRPGEEEWAGWMVSPDLDYATDRDVLLEPDDGPAHPMAGMVQTWNPLTLRVPSNARVLAKLSDFRLSIVREVANEAGTTIPPAPGKIGLRTTPSGRNVLTGSRLGGQDDPRVAYQKLYVNLAQSLNVAPRSSEAVRQAHKSADSQTGGFLDWLLGHRIQVAGFAATLAGVVVAANVLLRGSEVSDPLPGSQVAMKKPSAADAPAPPPPTPVASPADTLAQHESPSVVAPEKLLKKAPAKTELARSEEDPAPGTGGSDTRLATTESEALFLSPLKGKAFELAMRSGSNAQYAVAAYRVRVKNRNRLDEAVTFLDSIGLRVSRVDEETGVLDVMAGKDIASSAIESKLKASGLFLPTRSGNSGE